MILGLRTDVDSTPRPPSFGRRFNSKAAPRGGLMRANRAVV